MAEANYISGFVSGRYSMAFITFIAPYKPIICGVADYTGFVTREAPTGNWDVLSFNLDKYGVPLTDDISPPADPVWYGIPSRDNFSASSILKGIRPHENQVLWFQHEFGIWRDDFRFVNMLRDLNIPKIVTLHSLHFESRETRYGLRGHEYSFLRSLLPQTDAITVFSNGVHRAVTCAFPEYADKVHVLRHGTHLYPQIASMSRRESKARIYEYLIDESGLDKTSKDHLRQQRVFLDSDTVIIGGAGFITHTKGIELLYYARRLLQQMLPRKNIVALYVGHLREPDNSLDTRCAEEFTAKYCGPQEFFLVTYLPAEMLALLLRSLDVYFYWPSDCSQSGIVAHALGTGAIIACRELEGVGETVKMAGGVAQKDFKQLVSVIRDLILDPKLKEESAKRALRYAEEFSWRNQALRHFELAGRLCDSKVRHPDLGLPLAAKTATREEAPAKEDLDSTSKVLM